MSLHEHSFVYGQKSDEWSFEIDPLDHLKLAAKVCALNLGLKLGLFKKSTNWRKESSLYTKIDGNL